MRTSLSILIIALLWPSYLLAEEYYHEIPFSELELTSGKIPGIDSTSYGMHWQRQEKIKSLLPYAIVQGGNEAFIHCPNPSWSRITAKFCRENRSLIVKSKDKSVVSGSLFIPNAELEHLVKVDFKYTPTSFTTAAKSTYKTAKERYYHNVVSSGAVGTPWFRYKSGKKNLATAPRNRRRGITGSPEDSYAMFTGARAVAENLQLDRILPFNEPGQETVELSTLTGITIQEYDWKALLEGKNPELDPLASYVPHDQYALFFPSYYAFGDLVKEAESGVVPIFDLFESRAEDHRSLPRYEAQLGLSVKDVTPELGNMLIQQVVLTSSDPYVRSGTDIAVLFKTQTPEELYALIKLKAKTQHVHKTSDAVIVSNSKVQIDRFKQVKAGTAPSMASLDEYKFFRSRYTKDADETAFLMVTDAAIRKWAGPKWRIAASRRLRAAAVMNSLLVENIENQKNLAAPKTFSKSDAFGMDDVVLDKNGISSKLYGNITHLTPISELNFTKVSKTEERMYKRYRDAYQNRWANFFDPIAVQFKLSKKQLSANITVMPLIGQSDYNELTEFLGGKGIEHVTIGDKDILKFSFGINRASRYFRSGSNMLVPFTPTLANPLGWLGSNITLRVSDSSFWKTLQEQENIERHMEDNFHRSPIGLEFDVSDKLKLAGFLTAIRAMANQSAPGLLIWENLSHNETQYVKISANDPRSVSQVDWAVYYATLPTSLVVTWNQDTLISAIDGVSKENLQRKPIGKHIDLDVKTNFLRATETLLGTSYQANVRDHCFNHLPILTEWKKLFPNADPVVKHEELWGLRLRCEGGYKWNETWQTMESVKYGHPGELKELPKGSLGPVEQFIGGKFGLTFENDGLRAKIVLEK